MTEEGCSVEQHFQKDDIYNLAYPLNLSEVYKCYNRKTRVLAESVVAVIGFIANFFGPVTGRLAICGLLEQLEQSFS